MHTLKCPNVISKEADAELFQLISRCLVLFSMRLDLNNAGDCQSDCFLACFSRVSPSRTIARRNTPDLVAHRKGR